MNAKPVGQLTLPNGAEVWVVRHLISLDAQWHEKLQQAAQTTVDTLGKRETPGVYRAHLTAQDDGLRSFVEVAVTFGGYDEAFEI
jgi:hypothetical protein